MVLKKPFFWSSTISYNMNMFKKSIIGRIISISYTLVLATISLLLLIKVFKGSEKYLSYHKSYTDLSIDDTRVNLGDENQLALKIVISGTGILYSGDDIREALNITFLQSTRFSENGHSKYNNTKLRFDKWSEFDFKNHHPRKVSF